MMNKNKDHEKKKNKKPRLTWSEELHRKFVNVVNLLGIENAVPRKILAFMNDERLTKENVASHLQKYKLSLKRISSSCVPNKNGSIIGCGQFQNVSPSDPVYQNDAVQQKPMSTLHSDERLDSLVDDVLLQWWEDNNQDPTDLSDVIGTLLNTPPLKDAVNSNLGSTQDLVTLASSSCVSHESIEIGELRQEIAATRNETRQLRETIHALKAQQDMLVQVVLQLLPPNVLTQQ
ncbi:hypothetical protein TanjilG_15714 [Lupinus angustifolius]|uniref:HTH myb-type domain-containing protein n=1 Tax=Lupinus angustifolius TaxID=3871 RepID=A0A1J7HNF6_LUPAN|nr:PREDICTED: two-component response regulator ORR26-like [Lupinus angustifolius]XP_019438817.1 PREDICTED: two-component response regulator ORR26-like [Lupinus angustifolius]OIW14360.1 hypothetical protein TanjilG_15714 [Lupinus angustifolius]